LRTLTAILLTGGSLLAVVRDPAGMSPAVYTAGLGVLWGAVALELLSLRWQASRRSLDISQLFLDLVAVTLVIAATPQAPGLTVFYLGPVAFAALRMGREGAVAAAAVSALALLLPDLLRDGLHGPMTATTGLGAVLLLTSGLVAGELVRLATRRRRAEMRAALRARRTGQEVQMILDNLGSGLLTVSASGCVTRINPLASSILGLDGFNCEQCDLDGLLGDDGQELADLVSLALQDGRSRKRANVSVQRGERRVPLGVNVDFLIGEGGAMEGVVVVFSDLTEVRRLESHLRRSDRLAGVGELAASIAHELRNPLASIRGSVELLAGELEVEDHQAQLMQLILRESGRLNTIITDFLAFARLRPAQLRTVDLDSFLEGLVLQLRQHVSAKGGTVDVVCERQDHGLQLMADPEQLVQAFLNLGINACEAMHLEGELRLQINAGEGCCELRVSDTGPGLDLDRAEDIFTPFVTTKQHGTGLGLPMVARIVHGHGGTVEAGNNPAGGAEFLLRLPLAEKNSAERAPEASENEPMAMAVH